ncbi:MAG: asparagine synthase (glutamine-hydrolyzing) [Hyphomicrobiaceae bacterium]
MCGLFCSIGFAPDEKRIDIVAHRGPDGRGWLVQDSPSGPVALGHRRLAIIDVTEGGQQPMVDPSGRFSMIFNGEIYNYLELRHELVAKGEIFLTQSDSEVLLRAFMVWGAACLPRLRGMFAFAIWDNAEKRLFLARDRFGIKPLYFVTSVAGVAFASEIKQLLGLMPGGQRLNLARVHDFLAYGISDHTAETLFNGVLQLRGGEAAVVDAGGCRPDLKLKRWYPVQAGSITLDEASAAERFRELLADAVRLHLRSDVPVGSCLSGGLDSSAIVCLMAGMTPPGRHVNTVSACYEDKRVDEKPFMDAVVLHAGTRPFFIYPKPEQVFQKSVDITWHQDEPFGSTSIFAQWCVFEEARRAGIKVMLDGQGADEQLAGYHFAFPHYIADLTRRGRLLQVVRTIVERRRLHSAPLAEQLKRYAVPLLPKGLGIMLRRHYHSLVQHDWLSGEALRESGNPLGPMQAATAELGLKLPHDIGTLCVTMMFASNLQMLLHWEDRNSMAHSIEARVPFLDHPLAEFSLALGNDHKIVGADTKRVLRRAMAGALPDAVANRRDKLGFATPEQQWFRGPLKGLVHDGVESTLSAFPGLFNAAGARRLRDSMLNGRAAVDPSLWRIVNLGQWAKVFGVTL